MITARTIDTIQQEYLAGLSGSGSNLVIDTTEGSLAYTLSRASAAIALQQDNRLLDTYDNSSLLEATDSRLDQLALGIVTREAAAKAQGNALLSTTGSSKTVNVGAVLIEPTTGLQFVTTSSANVLAGLETSVSVEAVETGVSSNLLPGVSLYVSTDSTVTARIGSTHTDKYYGSLSGGRELETDTSFRQRVLNSISVPNNSSDSLLSQVLSYPSIDRAFVKTTVPGIIEIWFTASEVWDTTQLNTFKTYIEPYIAPGVVIALMQGTAVPVSFTIDVKPYASDLTDLSGLSKKLSDALVEYVSSLSLGQTLQLENVVSVLKPLASSVSVLAPITNVSVQVNQIVSIGNINYVFASVY